jgi:hypothetical protein
MVVREGVQCNAVAEERLVGLLVLVAQRTNDSTRRRWRCFGDLFALVEAAAAGVTIVWADWVR